MKKRIINKSNLQLESSQESIKHINESYDRYLYHATFGKYWKEIKKAGYIGNSKHKNWEYSNDDVVCLAADPDEAYSYCDTAEDIPESVEDSAIVVLKIDTNKLDEDKLDFDRNQVYDSDYITDDMVSAYEYSGIIPLDAVVEVIEESLKHVNESTNIDGENSLYQNINSDKLLVTNTKNSVKNSNFVSNKGMKADSKHPRTEDVIRNHKYFTFNQSYKDFNIYSPIKFIRVYKRNDSSMAGPFYKDTNITDYCAYKDNILVAYDKNLNALKDKIDEYDYLYERILQEVNMKKKIKETSIGEKIAKLVSEEFAGQCGPFGEEDPILKGNRMGLYSQNATIWYTFNDDGSIDVDYSEDDGDIDSTVPTHYASLKDLFLSADGWFYSREVDAEELLAKVEDILGGDDALIENVASDKIEEKSLGFNMDKLLSKFKKAGFEVTSAKMDENDFYNEFGYPWYESNEFNGDDLIAYNISINNIFDEDNKHIDAGVWVQSGYLETIGDFEGVGAYNTAKEVIDAIKEQMELFDYHLDEGPDALVEDYYDVNSVAKEIANKLSLSNRDLNTLIHDINNLRGIEWLDQVKSIGDESLLDMFKDVAQLDLDENIEKQYEFKIIRTTLRNKPVNQDYGTFEVKAKNKFLAQKKALYQALQRDFDFDYKEFTDKRYEDALSEFKIEEIIKEDIEKHDNLNENFWNILKPNKDISDSDIINLITHHIDFIAHNLLCFYDKRYLKKETKGYFSKLNYSAKYNGDPITISNNIINIPIFVDDKPVQVQIDRSSLLDMLWKNVDDYNEPWIAVRKVISTLIGNYILDSYFKPEVIEDLNEDIEKHDTLNPKLFDGDELKSEVKETIEKIANTFMEELANDGIKFTLKDIILLGSNVSYNYTKDSDLDIHLVADSSDLHCPDDLYPLLYSAYRSMFNKNYDITIKGIPSEIYVEMDNVQAKSNGIYSLNKGWIKKPVQTSIPDLDKEAFDKLFTEWEDRYFDLIKDKDLDESYRLDKLTTILLPTGLYGKDDLNILNSLIGQLSDGLWENSPRMEKYWKYMDFKEGPDGEIFIRVPTDYRWTFNLESSQDLRNWIAKHLKAVVKAFIKDNPDIGAEWKRDCLTTVDYLDDYPVQDIYRIYDKLLQRKDRIEKDAYIEALHPEKDLGWMGKGKRHLVDADTFTTAHDGDIIKVHILDGLPDLEYEISDGSYLDDEAVKDSLNFRDIALTADPTSSSAENFSTKLDNLISNAVKKSILDLLKKEYKDDFVYHRGGTTNDVVPMLIELYTARSDRRIPAILSDKEDIVESLSDNEKTRDVYIESTINEAKSDDIFDFITELYNLRKESIASEGEYGLGNLVFKEFRNLGYLDNLKKLRRDEKSKELSLESIKK